MGGLTAGAACDHRGMVELRWSPPARDDDPEWAGLLAAIESVDRRGETYDVDDLDDEWTSVWAHPETDATFVWEGPDLVAFGWLKALPGRDKAHRVACWGGVHPDHRRRGVGTSLLAWQVRRANEIAADLDPSLPTSIQLDALEDHRDLLRLASRAGFEPVRRFLDVARPTSLPVPPVADPAGVERRDWEPGLDEPVRLAHAVAFRDHWGSEPRTRDEWRQWYTGHRSFRPDLSGVAVDQATGAVLSYVLVAAYPQDWAHTPVEAWINTVGTVPAWRGRGIAAWLLSDVLARVAASDTGFERAILGVDADNPTGALRLYRRLGFEDVRATTTLALAPRPTPATPPSATPPPATGG
jgi:mycothiol synthase